MPNQTDDHPDAPDGVDPYPALSFAAVKWLNQRTGGPTGAYPDLPKVLTPVFYAQIDQSQIKPSGSSPCIASKRSSSGSAASNSIILFPM